MLIHLERLRFLHLAAEEGLISGEEHAQYRLKLLKAAIDITRTPCNSERTFTQAHAKKLEEANTIQKLWAWRSLIAALAEIIDASACRHVENRCSPAPTHSKESCQQRESVSASDGLQSEAKSSGGGRGRDCSPSFAFSMSGKHRDTKQQLPELDPLSIHVSNLWRADGMPSSHVKQDPIAIAAAAHADANSQRRCSADSSHNTHSAKSIQSGFKRSPRCLPCQRVPDFHAGEQAACAMCAESNRKEVEMNRISISIRASIKF